jgi:hypothetical protein
VEAFVAYAKLRGGVDGVIKHHRERQGDDRPTAKNLLEAWTGDLDDIADEVVEVPMPVGPESYNELVVTISRIERGTVGEGRFLVRPIRSIADQASVMAIIRGLDRVRSQQEKALTNQISMNAGPEEALRGWHKIGSGTYPAERAGRPAILQKLSDRVSRASVPSFIA